MKYKIEDYDWLDLNEEKIQDIVDGVNTLNDLGKLILNYK